MLQRLSQESHLVLGRREERLVEAPSVVMGDIAEAEGQPDIEPVREQPLVEVRFNEADELLGKVHLLLGVLPLCCSELVCRKIFDAAKHGFPSSAGPVLRILTQRKADEGKPCLAA